MTIIEVRENLFPLELTSFTFVGRRCQPQASDGGFAADIRCAPSPPLLLYCNTDMIVSAGQRYSFVLHANQKVGNYWVRANPNLGITGFDGGINSAILRYVGAPKVEPKTNSTGTTPLVETALHPLVHIPVPGKPYPGGADVTLNLLIALNFTTFRFTINGAVCVLRCFLLPLHAE
jgi:hypothetical protein